MARIFVDDIVMVGNESPWVSTSYEVYTDETMTVPLFKSPKDNVNRDFVIVTLRYPNGDLYPPELGSYARLRTHLENGTYSRWFETTCGQGEVNEETVN